MVNSGSPQWEWMRRSVCFALSRSHQTTCPLTARQAYNLPFSDDVFDCLSDITVIQHIPYELQPKALREMVRVLKARGPNDTLGANSRAGSACFSSTAAGLDSRSRILRATLMDCFGQEFFFPDRLCVRLAQTLFGGKATTRTSCRLVIHLRKIPWRVASIGDCVISLFLFRSGSSLPSRIFFLPN
jgi:hypothetical protein